MIAQTFLIFFRGKAKDRQDNPSLNCPQNSLQPQLVDVNVMPGHEIISHMATVKGCIEGHNATFIIDSGSGITVMSSQVIAHIPSISSKGLVTCPSMTVRSVTGQDLKVIGKINTNLEICGHTINFTEDFHFDCLLGTDILSA